MMADAEEKKPGPGKTSPKRGSGSKRKQGSKPKGASRSKAASKPKAGAKPKAASKKSTSKSKAAETKLPEQKLGDTPVAPWEMPKPEEKAQAKPVRRALKEAVKKVDTEEKADRVISHLEAATAGTKAAEVAKEEPPAATPAEAAGKVEQAAESAQGTKKTEKVLETTARVLVTPADKRQKEVVSEAAQEVLNPQQQGAAPTVTDETQRDLLRKAVLKRLKPLDAVDAQGFLAVNHLPHTHLLNSLFYGLTLAYMGGAAWYAAMAAAALRKPRSAGRLFREVAVPLTVTGVLVEYPIKTYFKRRRPFISIIQAIVIGKKPGSWSFPSGHSAMAFGGAWLLNKRFPKFAGLTYTLASLVAFSRIYLGDHYPGDVLSGSSFGILFAVCFRWLALFRRRK